MQTSCFSSGSVRSLRMACKQPLCVHHASTNTICLNMVCATCSSKRVPCLGFECSCYTVHDETKGPPQRLHGHRSLCMPKWTQKVLRCGLGVGPRKNQKQDFRISGDPHEPEPLPRWNHHTGYFILGMYNLKVLRFWSSLALGGRWPLQKDLSRQRQLRAAGTNWA